MNPFVKQVNPLEDYRLEIGFENGECRVFDAKPYLQRGVFARLQNRAAFRAARVVAGSVEWLEGLDLSYDTLYLESQPIDAPIVVEPVSGGCLCPGAIRLIGGCHSLASGCSGLREAGCLAENPGFFVVDDPDR